MDLQTFLKQNIRIHCKDGPDVEGVACGFTQALDNEPEVDSVTVRPKIGGLIMLYENEIKSIEVLD